MDSIEVEKKGKDEKAGGETEADAGGSNKDDKKGE